MKETKREIFENRGITLIALIITIIVLLILAGVSLSFVFNGGILDKAQMAVNKYEEASKNEQEILNSIDEYLSEEIGGGSGGEEPENPDPTPEEPTKPDTPTVDEDGLATEDTTIVAVDDEDIQIVIPKGFAPAILETGRTDSMPGENGAVKSIMPKEQWNSITAEQINKGIVVVDYAITYTGSVPDFNEYVWIPISDSSKFARVAWNGPYWNGSSWQEGEHPLANSSETKANKYWEEADSNMIDSVRNNKGFYISRYEASQKDSTTAQSKRGQEPWVRVSQTEAKTASSNMKTEMNSHLIYGVEWDSILQWLLDSQAKIGADTVGEPLQTIAIEDIQSDSRSWGNYNNSVGGAAENSGSRQPSGINEYWKVNNIYDLAGNVREWTQENYSTGTGRAIRGGVCGDDGDNIPAANRGYNDVGFTNKHRPTVSGSAFMCSAVLW